MIVAEAILWKETKKKCKERVSRQAKINISKPEARFGESTRKTNFQSHLFFMPMCGVFEKIMPN